MKALPPVFAQGMPNMAPRTTSGWPSRSSSTSRFHSGGLVLAVAMTFRCSGRRPSWPAWPLRVRGQYPWPPPDPPDPAWHAVSRAAKSAEPPTVTRSVRRRVRMSASGTRAPMPGILLVTRARPERFDVSGPRHDGDALLPGQREHVHRAPRPRRVPAMEDDDRPAAGSLDRVLATGADHPRGRRRQQRLRRLPVRAREVRGAGVPGGVLLARVVVRRVQQGVDGAVPHQVRRLDEAALPRLVLLDQLDPWPGDPQAVRGRLLQGEPGVLAAAVAVVLPQQVPRAVGVDEGRGVDRAALVGRAHERRRPDGLEGPGRARRARHADALD